MNEQINKLIGKEIKSIINDGIVLKRINFTDGSWLKITAIDTGPQCFEAMIEDIYIAPEEGEE